MEDQKKQVYDFAGAITCLSAGEQVKVLADIVSAMLLANGWMDQALLYAQSQVPDKELQQEKARLQAEEALAFKKSQIKVSPLLDVKAGSMPQLGAPQHQESQEQQDSKEPPQQQGQTGMTGQQGSEHHE